MQTILYSMVFSVLFLYYVPEFSPKKNFDPQGGSALPEKPAIIFEYNYKLISNIEYAKVDSQSLQLDLYQPQGMNKPAPVLLWLHGGAFTGGDKANAGKYAPMFARDGIEVAAVNYRLAPGARYPSQMMDVKGAIRFLRANAARYHIDPNHIGVLGTSAGGSLACQVAVRCGEKDFEGTVGGNLDYSSCVQAAVDCFGSFSYENMMKVGFNKSRSRHLEELLGVPEGSPEFNAKIKEMAPEFHLDKNDPPFLILHGDQDHTVPVQNSIDFDKKLKAAGIPSKLIIAPGYDHDVRMVVTYFDEVMKFLNQYLQ